MVRVHSLPALELGSAELVRAIGNLDTFFSRYVELARPGGSVPSSDPLHGLYISPAEAPELLRSHPFPLVTDPISDLLQELPRFTGLARSDGLDGFETAALLLAVAPELELRYERVYGYLNDDVTRRWPTVDLTLNLLCRSLEEKLAHRERFTPGGTLIRSGVLRAIPDPNQLEPSLPAHALKPDEHAVSWLTGSIGLHSRLVTFAELSSPAGPFPPTLEEAVDALWSEMPPRWALQANAATAAATAHLIAARLGSPVLRARMSDAGAACAPILFRQARLSSAVVLLEELDRIDSDADRRTLMTALAGHDGAVVAESHPEWIGHALTSVDLRSDERAIVGTRKGHDTSGLMRRLQPAYGWNDLILPDGVAAQLREICDQAKHQHTVMTRWGFGHKGRGGGHLTALFSGPSGTGKTMAAEVLSDELGQDLYRIDLSQVMSKFIGETEKNLSLVFDRAERSGAMLFFDEADALFGKRSPVKDSHDRYANVEVSYLLQRMEEYRGVAILATNLRHNMDTAFVRRLRFSVEFPFPDETIRARIWAVQFPSQAPLADDLNVASLARRFPLAGGAIRNVALNAAYLAAAAGESIAMAHVIRAMRREYQKMGRSCTEDEFGPYYALLQAAASA